MLSVSLAALPGIHVHLFGVKMYSLTKGVDPRDVDNKMAAGKLTSSFGRSTWLIMA